ncbi:Nephrin [Nymphon striatum]|nr:Nephrin [Nymphon striatum]
MLFFICFTGSMTKTAVVGHTVDLPCNITSPLPGDSMTLVLWYKGGSEVPLYSLDARSGLDVVSPEHFVDDFLKPRASFRVRTNPPVLVISRVIADDEGVYTCRVDFRQARSISNVVKLLVITPPERPRIQDESGSDINGLIGPYNEGDTLRLICTVKQGRPRPILKWLMSDRVIDELSRRLPDGTIENELTINRLKRSDLTARLTCQASNNNITNPSTSFVLVDLNLNPLKVKILTQKSWVSAGRLVRFECQCIGSRPPAVITWWKGNEKVTNSEEIPSSDPNITTSIMSFVPKDNDNQKYISCRGENPKIRDSAKQDGWKLKVHYMKIEDEKHNYDIKPKLVLETGKHVNPKQIKETNDVYFLCNSVANPAVSRYKWFFEGKRLVQDKEAGVLIQGNSLVLQKIKRHRKGKYACSAKNSEGSGISNSFKLSIRREYINVSYYYACIREKRKTITSNNFVHLFICSFCSQL